MSPAQSEDSGLAADRGTYTTYATISIPRKDAQDFFAGIVFAGKLFISQFIILFLTNFCNLCWIQP